MWSVEGAEYDVSGEGSLVDSSEGMFELFDWLRMRGEL